MIIFFLFENQEEVTLEDMGVPRQSIVYTSVVCTSSPSAKCPLSIRTDVIFPTDIKLYLNLTSVLVRWPQSNHPMVTGLPPKQITYKGECHHINFELLEFPISKFKYFSRYQPLNLFSGQTKEILRIQSNLKEKSSLELRQYILNTIEDLEDLNILYRTQ